MFSVFCALSQSDYAIQMLPWQSLWTRGTIIVNDEKSVGDGKIDCNPSRRHILKL